MPILQNEMFTVEIYGVLHIEIKLVKSDIPHYFDKNLNATQKRIGVCIAPSTT